LLQTATFTEQHESSISFFGSCLILGEYVEFRS